MAGLWLTSVVICNCNKMKIIKNPEFKFIKTNPSTLGTVDFYIVIYKKSDFSGLDSMLDLKESEIAEEIYETGEYKGFYVIHSSSNRGDSINLLENYRDGFYSNRVNCDSILSYHCLAIKNEQSGFKIRTGFHEANSEVNLSRIINDWNSMTNVSNGFHEIEVNKEAFVQLYEKQIKKIKKADNIA